MVEDAIEINDNISREHIQPPAICSQEDCSFVDAPVHLISRAGYLVYASPPLYVMGGDEFILENGVFTYDSLSFSLPRRENFTPIEKIYLSLGYPLTGVDDAGVDLDVLDLDFRNMLHMLTTMALKDFKLITSQFTMYKQKCYGEHIFEVYLKSVTGKGNIQAKNKHIRWLNDTDTLQLKSKLFTTSSYQAGVESMRYEPTAVAIGVFKRVFELFSTINFQDNEISLESLDFSVSAQQLKKIKLRDTMLLLSNCIGYNDDFIIRPKITDEHYGRVYSVFSSISSHSRELLGYINYDIGSALQTICLQLVDDSSKYPLHQQLVNDKVAFRNLVAEESRNNLVWVKRELSKIDNLDKMPKKYNNYPTLKAYFEEALPLREEVLAGTNELVLNRAKLFAKPKWETIYIAGKKQPEIIQVGIKESSLYFFIWTQYEREIREAMMSCFSDSQACHQVHDAVYSKENLDVRLVQERVQEQTRFKVKISKN